MRRLDVPRTRLTVDDVVATARRNTGLRDFGDEAFREPLARLIESVEEEAQLNPVGRLITRTRLVGALEVRLRVEAAFSRHPEIETETVRAPIVIASLQRTGTTLLHRLLSVDPAIRALLTWEALDPVPPQRRWLTGFEPRLLKAWLAERSLAYMAPDFFAVHPAEARSPEEDVLLLDYSFLSTVAESTLRVPSYAAWLEQQDQAPAYHYMSRLLQLMQWQRPARRWVLKSPHHLEWLDTLLAVFPQARVIQTHRDPLKVVASFCSMIAHARGVFSDAVDPREVGRHWFRKQVRLISRAMATRERRGDAGFIDVSYYDLVADPIGEARRVYDRLGEPLTPAAEAAMRASLPGNRKNKYGRHHYRLEDFGLDVAEIERQLAAYRERFAIRRE